MAAFQRGAFRCRLWLGVAFAAAAAAGCTRMFPEPEFPEPQSSLEAARLAESRNWTSRLITASRDTVVGHIRTLDDHILIADKNLTPGQVYRLERRIGSSHVSARTVAAMALGALGAYVAGQSRIHSRGAGYVGAPALAWAAAGASAGLTIGVFAQFGTDESKWEPTWSQFR